MKKLSKLIFTLVLIIVASQLLSAQGSPRTALKEKLKFYYVPNPATSGRILLNNEHIFNDNESGIFWNSTHMRNAQHLVRALLKSQNSGGDASLQSYVAGILEIVNKPIKVYLYNDISRPLSALTVSNWGMCLDNNTNRRAWPCAINQSLDDDYAQEIAHCVGDPVPSRDDDEWGGTVHMGAFHLNRNDVVWGKGTFVHEVMHTQDLSDSRVHLFWVNGDNYRYGADRGHYDIEAVPNLSMTYKEGIANTLTLLYQGNLAEGYFNWFSGNHHMMVEINPNPEGAGPGNVHQCLPATQPSADAWLYNQLIRAGLTENGRDSTGTYAYFRIRDLPAKFIAHNEFILALIFSEYVRHVSYEKFINALKKSNNELFRVSASGIAVLFQNMCEAGLPDGVTPASIFSSSVTSRKTYLLPLAYADYFTAYNSSSKNEFKQLFENLLSDNWIDLYWDHARSQVRSSVPANNPRREDLTDIAVTLGVTTSVP